MKSIRNSLAIMLCWLFAPLPLTAAGATMSIVPSYVQSFDAALNSIGELADDGAATPVGGYLQYEFRLSVNDLAADEDFWTAIFDVQLAPGLENGSGWLDPGVAQTNGYYPASPSLAMYDSNGATSGGIQAHWQFGNADFGSDATDLKSIIVEASPQEAANRQYGEAVRPGQGAANALGFPTLLGTVLVRRTEMIPSSVAIVPIAGSAWGIYTLNEFGDGIPTSQAPASFPTSTIQLNVPEPATFGLALSALVAGLLFCRRRAGLCS